MAASEMKLHRIELNSLIFYSVNKGKVRSLLPADFLARFGKNRHGKPEMLMKKIRFPSTFLDSGD